MEMHRIIGNIQRKVALRLALCDVLCDIAKILRCVGGTHTSFLQGHVYLVCTMALPLSTHLVEQLKNAALDMFRGPAIGEKILTCC